MMSRTIYHPQLAAGGWQKLSFAEQMANIGSEVERAINWRKRGHNQRSQAAFFRAVELLDLTKEQAKSDSGKLKELCRLKEVLGDYFLGDNIYQSSDDLWQKYFRAFTWWASLQRGK